MNERINLFSYSFIHLLIYPFVPSCLLFFPLNAVSLSVAYFIVTLYSVHTVSHSFTYSVIHLYIYWLIDWLISQISVSQSLIHLVSLSTSYSVILLITHSLIFHNIHSVIQMCIHLVKSSIHLLIRSWH